MISIMAKSQSYHKGERILMFNLSKRAKEIMSEGNNKYEQITFIKRTDCDIEELPDPVELDKYDEDLKDDDYGASPIEELDNEMDDNDFWEDEDFNYGVVHEQHLCNAQFHGLISSLYMILARPDAPLEYKMFWIEWAREMYEDYSDEDFALKVLELSLELLPDFDKGYMELKEEDLASLDLLSCAVYYYDEIVNGR